MGFLRPSAVKQTTQSAGLASALTLLPNAGDTRSFQDALGAGPVRCRYMVRGNGYFFQARGTFTAPDQLTRDEIIKSSNSDSDVSIPAGTSDVYLLDYWQFLSDRFSTNKTLTNKDSSNSWIFTGTAAAALTFPAISTALPDFWGFVKNTGSAILTLTGNGSDTFDESAATTLRLFPGESAFIFLDLTGTIWRFVRAGTIASNPNKIINGDMRINQRGAGTVSTGTGGYTVDRWQCGFSAASKFSYGPSTDAPPGFSASLLFTSLSAYSAAAGDTFLSYQKIEGLNCIDMGWGAAGAKPIAVSFWVKASQTGNYSFALRNSAGNRSYVTTYNVAVANTWEFKTIIVPGDTSGTWLVDNGVGLRVEFDLGCGTTYQTGSTNAWQAANYMRATGSVSVVGTNGATHRVTGVKVETGNIATPFVMQDFASEFYKCLRYCWVWAADDSYTIVTRCQVLSQQAYGTIQFPEPMRAVPVMSNPTGSFGYTNETGGSNQSGTSIVLSNNILGSGQNSRGARMAVTGLTGISDGAHGYITTYNSGGAKLVFDAEL